MTREEQLLEIVGDNVSLEPLITEMVYLEEQLDYLRGLPKIRVNKKDSSLQKVTPAAKLYKEMLQQYTNVVRILMKATGVGEEEIESPLREWVSSRMGNADK